VQLIARGFVLQRADLIHHKTPDLMAGSITGQPRPLGPERGIELGLTPIQPDQMLGHMPESFSSTNTPVFVSVLPENRSNVHKRVRVPPLD
jgi:hypothetical protein